MRTEVSVHMVLCAYGSRNAFKSMRKSFQIRRSERPGHLADLHRKENERPSALWHLGGNTDKPISKYILKFEEIVSI